MQYLFSDWNNYMKFMVYSVCDREYETDNY
jgi:hypothetical protein